MSAANPEPSASLLKHVAIIMDGNGRWAMQRRRPRAFGHQAGLKAVRKVIEAAVDNRVEFLTLFAFSSENWGRPQDEVSRLMQLFMTSLDKEVKRLHENGVKLRFIGDASRFPESMQAKMQKAEQLTSGNERLCVTVALNYGGYWDICQAARRACEDASPEMSLDAIFSPENIDRHLALRPVPPPDLLIRSGGDQRISNFLLWDIAYSELYFTQTLWPDFGKEEFSRAVKDYYKRQRRFGLTGQQVVSGVSS
ncbi:MAG: di-trans,poly-cis-decaprenylcistransferase [Gammaproteobacteria bacterium]|nr:MAG: di-trans,poly-cis-decaprenylcistransferase [Gammaproteobacteria bacterium]